MKMCTGENVRDPTGIKKKPEEKVLLHVGGNIKGV